MKENLFTESLKQSTGMRIFLYFIILLVCCLLGAFASAFLVIGNNDTLLKIGQGISSAMMFIVPPIVYYFITRKEHPMHDLGFRKVSPVWLILAGIALMFISLPVTNQLTTWNEGLKFGGALQTLEDLLKNLEETAEALTERMLNVNTFGGLLFNLLIIALIPAIGEELTFRGVLQQSLTRRMNPHIAIILSAAIFSFIHFQFYGFLPRMFLGIVLGYMFYISGSLWTSILMHFLNNGTAVVLYYLNNKDVIDIDVDHFGALQNRWLIAGSMAVTAGLMVWSWWKKKPLDS
jgi:membrane protease YdiL (CAAX protease family)